MGSRFRIVAYLDNMYIPYHKNRPHHIKQRRFLLFATYEQINLILKKNTKYVIIDLNLNYNHIERLISSLARFFVTYVNFAKAQKLNLFSVFFKVLNLSVHKLQKVKSIFV